MRKRNQILLVAKITLDDENIEKFSHLIGRLKSHGPLRNAIAHTVWVEGTRPNSLRPAQMDIRDGKPKAKGFNEEDVDYTLEEFYQAADSLIALNEDLHRFQRESGLRSIMELKIAEANSLSGNQAGYPIGKERGKPAN